MTRFVQEIRVERDNRTAFAAGHAEQQVPVDQRMARKTPQRHGGVVSLRQVFRPDDVPLRGIEAEQIAHLAEDIHLAGRHRGRRTGRPPWLPALIDEPLSRTENIMANSVTTLAGDQVLETLLDGRRCRFPSAHGKSLDITISSAEPFQRPLWEVCFKNASSQGDRWNGDNRQVS
jgi:hypothetical protein